LLLFIDDHVFVNRFIFLDISQMSNRKETYKTNYASMKNICILLCNWFIHYCGYI